MENKKEPEKKEEPKKLTMIEQARTEADRIEKGNADFKELLDRQEKMLAEQKLGGQADAGQQAEKPKEVSPIDYAKEVLAGKHNEPATEKK